MDLRYGFDSSHKITKAEGFHLTGRVKVDLFLHSNFLIKPHIKGKKQKFIRD